MHARELIGFAIVAAAPLAGTAAPYCTDVQGIPLQCLYYDPGQCEQEAARLGGHCAANSAELKTPLGPGKFCIVEAAGVISCNYNDRTVCSTDAGNRSTACINATPAPRKVTPGVDPFRLQRNY